jgi:hypothetical protein
MFGLCTPLAREVPLATSLTHGRPAWWPAHLHASIHSQTRRFHAAPPPWPPCSVALNKRAGCPLAQRLHTTNFKLLHSTNDRLGRSHCTVFTSFDVERPPFALAAPSASASWYGLHVRQLFRTTLHVSPPPFCLHALHPTLLSPPASNALHLTPATPTTTSPWIMPPDLHVCGRFWAGACLCAVAWRRPTPPGTVSYLQSHLLPFLCQHSPPQSVLVIFHRSVARTQLPCILYFVWRRVFAAACLRLYRHPAAALPARVARRPPTAGAHFGKRSCRLTLRLCAAGLLSCPPWCRACGWFRPPV